MMARKQPSLDNMRFPPGRKPGLKRDTRAKIADRCPPVSSVIEEIPERYWDELASSKWHASKREQYRYTSDQNGIRSCAAESACNTKAACDTRQGLPLVVYNPLAMYHTTSGGRDNGSVIGDNLEYGRETGCVPEELWPRAKGWRAAPSREAIQVARFFRIREFYYVETVRQFVSALLQGYNIHAGYSGHAVSFVRYLGRGRVEFKNSWGNWGDAGFVTLSTSNIYFGYGAYAYKDVIPYVNAAGEWGVVEADGSWTPCPWQPQFDQAVLAAAVGEFMAATLARAVLGQRPMSPAAAEDTYRAILERHELAV